MSRGFRSIRWMLLAGLRSALATFVALAATAPISAAPADEELTALDIEDLMELEVTSVSKRRQKVSEAAAAVFVITEDDIRRSGALSIPEVLRMVPGLHVAQIDATHWVVSSRGFSEEFANKLLVLIDGRSVYTPAFSGVIWAEHDLMLEDVERIEVIRGPGGTLWGANAVNGVINVITKTAADTQGVLASSQVGSYERFSGSSRFGGKVGDAHYRVYGKFADRDEFEDPPGGSADDGTQNIRAGGRVDWNLSENDLFTFQGDYFDVDSDKALVGGIPDGDENSGGNVLARLTHEFSDDSSLSIQSYYDRADREQLVATEERDTFDVEVQHTFQPITRNQMVWGAGYRVTSDRLKTTTPAVGFADSSRTDSLANLFLQDEISLVEGLLSMTLGSKFEHNDYTGWELQPSGRILLTPGEHHSVWGAVSRAVRTPSRVDHSVVFTQVALPDITTITGASGFESEDLLAYELGYRTRVMEGLTFDLAAYYNDYDDLRAGALAAPPILGPPNFFTFELGNRLEGEGYGVELDTRYAVNDYWQLVAGYTFSRLDLEQKDASTLLPTTFNLENQTPRHRFSIRSMLNLPWNFKFDTSLYWNERLGGLGIDAHTRLDLRLAWEPRDDLELSLVGLNVIEEQQEFPSGLLIQPTVVPQSFYGSIRWKFN